MDNAPLVRGDERFGQRDGEFEKLWKRETAGCAERRERLSLDQLHGEEAYAEGAEDLIGTEA